MTRAGCVLVGIVVPDAPTLPAGRTPPAHSAAAMMSES